MKKDEESEAAVSGPAPIKVGDVLQYFPHALYAKEMNQRTKSFPWEFGWNVVRQDDDLTSGPKQRSAKPTFEIRSLTHAQLKQKLEFLARHSDPSQEQKRLVPLRPLESWPAKVTEVNDDGTVDLAVESGTRSGVTLNLRGVKIVEQHKVRSLRAAARDPGAAHPACELAHTCHRENA